MIRNFRLDVYNLQFFLQTKTVSKPSCSANEKYFKISSSFGNCTISSDRIKSQNHLVEACVQHKNSTTGKCSVAFRLRIKFAFVES